MVSARRSTRVTSSRRSPYNYGPPPARVANSDIHFYASCEAECRKLIKNSARSNEKYDSVIPESIFSLEFDAQKWKHRKQPTNIHGPWPPTSPSQLMNTAINLNTIGTVKQQNVFLRKHGDPLEEDCLGKYCWQTPNWSSSFLCAHDFDSREPCNHVVSEWKSGCADWQSRFEIRNVPNMGYGLFSKQVWKKGDVLGIYIGELIPEPAQNTDYCHQVRIGPEFGKLGAEFAFIDAERVGNYTRFCNHSCENNAVFTESRVGVERVLALRVVKSIVGGEEVTVDYGGDYFRERLCRCGSTKCRYSRAGNTIDEEKGSI